MAAEIIEYVEELEGDPLPTDDQELSTDELITDLEGTDTTAQPDPDELPDKYKGKSIQEVVSMHQQAEGLIGKHSGEVGELRRVVDGYIQAQLTPATQHAPDPVEPEVDFFEDPAAAVNKAIENHPEVVASRKSAQQSRQTTALTQLQAKHPDMKEVLENTSFIDWVKASPIRTELYLRADKDFDYNCADELIGQFKERQTLTSQTFQSEQAARQQAVRAGSTGAASGSAATGQGKKIYRRVDIIKLMKTDPDRYEALSGELVQAYRENRVR